MVVSQGQIFKEYVEVTGLCSVLAVFFEIYVLEAIPKGKRSWFLEVGPLAGSQCYMRP